jgi:NADPH-dependent 2,4-dienoyl-CoA reductase/sulfur reductase-like enzyme
MKKDIVIIGGGAAGLGAALKAYEEGVSVLVIEREPTLGGILNQCIHNGFGLHVFKEELTGPEYASRFSSMFLTQKIEFMLNSTVIDIQKTNDFKVVVSSAEEGLIDIETKAVILSTGCYERTRGQIHLPGDRPKGIMPAGSAQRYLNMEGYLVGQKVFILGSGDIGLIMARRMTLEGAQVLGVAELMPYSNGLTRNIVQCLEDFNIPLYLSHTVTHVKGKDRLEQITIAKVNDQFEPIEGTETTFEVDTLLLSIGLVPDVALFESLNVDIDPITKSAKVDHTYQTNVPGLFVCGNALHVHDLVDWVTKEAEKAGNYAKDYVKNMKQDKQMIPTQAGDKVRYVVPQYINLATLNASVELSFRVKEKASAVVFNVYQKGVLIQQKKAKHVAPAEMEKLMFIQKNMINHEPITVSMEVLEV